MNDRQYREETDLFTHVASAHLRTNNRLRLRSRKEKRDLVLFYDENSREYRVHETDTDENRVLVNIPYFTARNAALRLLDIAHQWNANLGDVEFSGTESDVAVTWRHLKIRLKTLRWILGNDPSIIAGILEEAENL